MRKRRIKRKERRIEYEEKEKVGPKLSSNPILF
jgi:hypothetical protein